MRAVLLSLAVVALATSHARAETTVGVIVVGDDMLRPRVTAYLEGWLEQHGHKVLAQPMSADAMTTLSQCVLIDDPKCARGVVEQRSKSDAIVFARAELGSDRGFVMNAYWFAKGHEAIAERRACEKCSEDGWKGVIDQILDTLTSQMVATGHLHVESDPPGMIVLFDNEQVGLTPLDRDVPVGHHRVDLMHQGHHVGKRNVEIDANDTTEVAMKAQLDGGGDAGGHPRLVPSVVLAGGIALLGVGGVMLYYGSLGGPSQKYVYPDATPIGIGVIAAGVGATIIGGVLFAQAGPKKSTPVAAVSHDGAYLGWVTQF